MLSPSRDSTLITSAPRSPSFWVAYGPEDDRRQVDDAHAGKRTAHIRQCAAFVAYALTAARGFNAAHARWMRPQASCSFSVELEYEIRMYGDIPYAEP